MALLLVIGVKHAPWPVRLAVVLQLERIPCDQHLRRPHKSAQRLNRSLIRIGLYHVLEIRVHLNERLHV